MNNFAPLITAYKELNNNYKSKLSQFSTVQATIKPVSMFARVKGEKQTVLIKGRLVTSKPYREYGFATPVVMRADLLKKSLSQWIGIPIYTSHNVLRELTKGNPVSAREVVGKIIKTEWNDQDQGIDYYAEIVDEEISAKMAANLINTLSVDFFREVKTDFDENNKLYNYYTGIEPAAASLLVNNDPRDVDAKFTVVDN